MREVAPRFRFLKCGGCILNSPCRQFGLLVLKTTSACAVRRLFVLAVAIFNIHLASGAVDPESRYVEDVRAAEIRQLLKACDDAADRGHVPLVIGDLNAGAVFSCYLHSCSQYTLPEKVLRILHPDS